MQKFRIFGSGGNNFFFFLSLILKAKFYLNIGKINTVKIIEHLVDLRSVLKNSTSCLSQVV